MTSTQIVLAGRYRLREPIGQGGMGRVWLATDTLLGRDVAVKELVPPPGFTEDEIRDMGARTVREARAAARLSHGNVIAVYDVVVESGAPWIVMEYVKGRSLYQVVADEGPLEVTTVAQIGLSVLAALVAAHRVGVLHRDVKPGNVLITDEHRVVLTDFGLATIVGEPAVTRSGVVIGSPSYMAPERARDGEAGPAADLWSLGATLYFAVEGHSPYERESALATITALATDEPAPMVRAGALLPILRGLLRRSPEERLTAPEVERLLRQAAASHLSPAALPPTPVPPTPVPPTPVRPTPGPPAGAPQPPGRVPRPRRPRTNEPRAGGPGTESADRTERLVGGRQPGLRFAVALGVIVVLAALAAWAVHSRVTAGQPDPVTPSASAAGPPASAAATSPNVAPPASTGPEPTGAATEPPVALPDGWHRYTDQTGFSVAVPADWSVSRNGSIVYFREPQGSRYLGIDQTDEPQPDPVADWTGKEQYRVARGDFPNYQRIRIEEVPYFLKAADWEFTYRSNGQPVHVLNRGFITSANQAYGMWWSTAESEWASSAPDLALIQRSFTPRPA